MTALLSYGIDTETNLAAFAIAADDTQAHYVWPARSTPVFDDSRIQDLEELLGQPTDAQGWLDLASTNVGLTIEVTDPVTQASVQDAISEARATLNAGGAVDTSRQPDVLARGREAFDQVSADYPGFTEGDQDDPEAMTNYVMSMLGGIEEGGPNAWIAQAAQGGGNPDQDPTPGFVAFPGVDYGAVYPDPTGDSEEGDE